MLPFNLDDQVKIKQQEMLKHAAQQRLVQEIRMNDVKNDNSSGWSLRQALQQAIALLAFQPPKRPERKQLQTGEFAAYKGRSKLATDSGIHRIR